MQEGDRVKLKPGSALAATHPELRAAVGQVGSIVRGASLTDPQHGARMHVRFPDLNVIAMNVPAGDLEAVDRLEPALRAI